MALKLANNAVSRLASSLAVGDTTLPVSTGEGAKFPTLAGGDWFPLTVVKADGSLEIMRCTARSGDNLTVTRAQESTTAKTFSAGDRVELRMTAATYDLLTAQLQQQVADYIASNPTQSLAQIQAAILSF
jgi:hypothetical protein